MFPKLTLLWWEAIFTFGLTDLGLLKAKGKEDIQYFGLCCVFCYQVSWPIQQQAHNFPAVSSAAEVSPGVFLAAFHHPHETQHHMDLSFLIVSLNPQIVPLLFLGYLSQLLPLAHFPSLSEIFWEFLVHPCRAPATLTWLPAHRGGPFFGSDTF